MWLGSTETPCGCRLDCYNFLFAILPDAAHRVSTWKVPLCRKLCKLLILLR
jgi:hypothetical protein